MNRLKYFRFARYCTMVLSIACLILNSQEGHCQEAGVPKTYSSFIAGSNLVAGAWVDLPYPPDNEQLVSIQNVITLSIVEESGTFLPDNFTASVTVQIDYGASSASTNSLQQVFQVTYNKGGGVTYNPKNYLSFSGARYVKCTVVGPVNAPALSNNVDPKTVLLLQNEMRVKRYYELNNSISLQPVSFTSQPLASTPTPDVLPINWQWPPSTGNNGSQLEWTWLEDELTSNYTNSDGSLNYNLLFLHNATRVDLPVSANSFGIPLFYDGQGKLYYRIRAFNLKGSGSESTGPWSSIQSYSFPGHNNNLNWQVSTSFAEDGKLKSVMQYFDGSLRMRQVVTKDNSTNTTLTSETFYDGQGRPAIQILPAPGINSIVGYTQNLNLFNGQTAGNDPAPYFDLQPVTLGGSATPSLNPTSGTARYYSGANPEVAQNNNPNLPDAGGYPYTVTRYTPDATGRVMSQSGVGKALSMGSGHETKYYYGNAAREELDGLFGTEAGTVSHYFKNMVQDGNGQMSVSYADMHGRTVATALAGDAPTGIVPLDLNATQYPGQVGSSMTRNLLDPDANVARDNAIEAQTTILVPATTNYQFQYSLNPQSLQPGQCNTTQLACYTCMYDLEIAITDESGDLPPIIRKFTNVSPVTGNSCNPGNSFTDEAYNGTLSTVGNNVIRFSEVLKPGSYAVRKTLTLSETAFQQARDQYLQVGLCKTKQQLIDSVNTVLMTTSDCNTPPTSPAPGGSYKLTAIQNMMLADMMPYSGQYAKDPANGSIPHPSMYSRYDIFSTATAGTQPFYRYPFNVSGALDFYYDATGARDQSIHPDPANPYQFLNTATPATFTGLFAPFWAQSLLPHHPEYNQLLFAQQKLVSSYNWMDQFNQVSTYAAALSGNFITSTGNVETVDPFFPVAASTYAYQADMNKMETVSYYNSLSMWQIAYGNTMCSTITDLVSRDNCYTAAPKQPPFNGLSTDQQDQIWNTFKGLYGNSRDGMVNDYIKRNKPLADGDQLVAQGYILRFPTSTTQVVNQYQWTGFPTNPGDAPTVSMNGSIATTTTSRCSGYIDHWKQALSQCAALAANPNSQAILTEITTGMEAVCEKGLDESNPYGASSVAPGTPQDGSPRSFEDVVNNVFAKYGISRDQYCNPFVVDFPKPYGQGPVFTKEVTSVVDNCACTQFAKISQAAIAAHYDPTVLSSLNQYLSNTYQETLTQALFDGLQHCSVLGTTTCRTITQITTGPCSAALTDACSVASDPVMAASLKENVAAPAASLPPASGGGSNPDTCTLVNTYQQCETIGYYMLSSPQPKPAFLACGFTGAVHCLSCSALSQYVSDYKAYFNGMPCAAAPILSTGNLTPDQISYNITFQLFVNYKSGLQFQWSEYAKAAAAAGCNLATYTTNGSATQNVICGSSQPLNDGTGLFVQDPPCQKVYNMAVATGSSLYDQRKSQLLADFETSYRATCMGAGKIENFSVQYNTKEYHYTLYYYDMAGNLVKTVPPKGARPDFSSGFIASVEAAKTSGTQVVPQHVFVTNYRYNSLNSVVAQSTPDAGVSSFWYDILGRLAVSQNAQQSADGKYSYTVYDPLGRVTEVGQKPQTTAMNQTVSQDPTQLNNWIYGTGGMNEQITNTVYDVPVGFDLKPKMTQQNLRNRISYVYTRNYASDAGNYSATYYTYDIHGNVDTLLHDYAGIPAMAPSNQYKRICYDYDLISGKVNGVDYQSGSPDAFYHRYQYDAENRLVQVQTSRDSIVWERDAAYSYYKHGPLARTVLGQLQPQGLDYSYTLQGWLKGVNIGKGTNAAGTGCQPGSAVDNAYINTRPQVNGPAVYTARNSIEFDLGFSSGDNGDAFETVLNSSLSSCSTGSGSGSGGSGSGSNAPVITETYPVGQDAFNFSLHYYSGDYQPIGSTVPYTGILEGLGSNAAPLFNGNIAAMAVNVPAVGDARVYNYHYDQLNRLSQMDAFSGLNSNANKFTPVQLDDYKERVSYDPNGNILNYLRNGYEDGTHHVPMDNLTYHYKPFMNQLDYLEDGATQSAYTTDIKTQNAGNYGFDLIGNLKSDNAESIGNIKWSVYGKILEVQRTATSADPNTDILYTYDAGGNRITKTVNNSITTVYVRDVQGSVMCVYQTSSNGLQQIETNLYGNSRLGLVKALTVAPVGVNMATGYGTPLLSTFTRGEKSYELGNHLGNVLATVSDNKIGVSSTTNSSLIDHYLADVTSAQDYYPFGMVMPGRSFTVAGAAGYRYGFNGKEKDNEVKGTGNQIDYGMRVYDPRAGRFLSVDPLEKKYPWYTPYQFAGNKPIAFIDVDGLEDQWTADGQHMQGPVLANTTAGQMLYNHPPQPGNPIITYSRGQSITKDPNPAYQYFSWNGIGGPSQITQSVFGNTLFKKGFDNYLPKRFIDHYELAGGQPYVMNRQEMNDVNMRSIGIEGGGTDASGGGEMARFQNAIKGLKVGETRNVKNWQILTGAYNSGTLGNFYATVNGTFTGVNNKDGSVGWVFQGTLQMNDYWDFDPDPTGQKRPSLAEGLVRFANKYLQGKPFPITSVLVPVNQTSNQNTFDYSTNPKIIPNRVASGVSDEQKTGDASGSGKPQ